MRLTFDPMTIEHLGFKMYSHLPNALAELVANCYDADSTSASIIIQNGSTPQVSVMDDGHGMSKEDLETKYLRIGRNKISDTGRMSESGKRRVAGKKGLGKLALFGIGNTVEVTTTRQGSTNLVTVKMNWDDMLSSQGEYEPKVTTAATAPQTHGTTVLIKNLKRKSSISAEDIANSLSKLFNYTDSTFGLNVKEADEEPIEVTRERRFKSIDIESEWQIPAQLGENTPEGFKENINGTIYASTKPLRQDLRGITLYVNGRLANEPEYFGVAESSHAFSYLTGFINVDYLDDLPEDVISTDRRSIAWEHPEAETLKEHIRQTLREAVGLHRGLRRTKERERVQLNAGIDPKAWAKTVKSESKSRALESILDTVTSPEADIPEERRDELITDLMVIAPEHADMHWRNLHESLQDACGNYYKQGDYTHALTEALKRYTKDLRRISELVQPNSTKDSSDPTKDVYDNDLLQRIFRKNNPLDPVKQWPTIKLSSDTENNLREEQTIVSLGMHKGFRNAIAHEEIAELERHGVINYQDCLDALSILSHLRRRIDAFDSPTETEIN